MTEIGPAGLLDRADPGRPMVTFYDDATGERIELSGRTLGNWVAKTANLLVDGLDAEPGERIGIDLPPHWQAAVWLLASWSAGLLVTLGDPDAWPAGAPDAGPEIVVLAQDALAGAPPEAREVVGLSLDAMGRPLDAAPPGVLDYAAEVRAYADRFVPYARIDPATPAVHVRRHAETGPMVTLTGVELMAEGRAAAERWELDERSRVLTDVAYTTLDGLLTGLIAPLCTGGSVIICRNLNRATLDRRISAERVTAVAGPDGIPYRPR